MKKKTQPVNKNESKYLYIGLFAISALILFSPLFLPYDLRRFHNLGLIGIAIINFITSASLVPTPGFLAVGIGGKLYNPLVVALISAISSTAGQTVGFLFGYSSKKLSASEKHILDRLGKLLHHKYAPILIILLAFIPNPFFDVVGIVAGVSLYPLKRFLFLVFIGRLLRDIMIAYAGHRFL